MGALHLGNNLRHRRGLLRRNTLGFLIRLARVAQTENPCSLV